MYSNSQEQTSLLKFTKLTETDIVIKNFVVFRDKVEDITIPSSSTSVDSDGQEPSAKRKRSIYFPKHLLQCLEEEFQNHPYIGNMKKVNLARRLNVSELRIKIWFQKSHLKRKNLQIANSDTLATPNFKSNLQISTHLCRLATGSRQNC
ncbi:homeobox protein Hox-B4-like [Rhynchophorus ferrugineus]|uniref:homeobox protein Hox-B4-like n=1 Tax=Rhynchophorus ferrugineus TaxID=354439 RepID=UPI003FCCB92E